MDNVKYCNQKYPNQSSGSKMIKKCLRNSFFPLFPAYHYFSLCCLFFPPKKSVIGGVPVDYI